MKNDTTCNAFKRSSIFVGFFLLTATMVTSLPMPRGEMGPWRFMRNQIDRLSSSSLSFPSSWTTKTVPTTKWKETATTASTDCGNYRSGRQRQRPHWWGAFMTRGGGLFGGKDDAAKKETAIMEEMSGSGGGGPLYPAMSQQEVEEWLEHVAVFAVTDSNGAGVILKPENDTSVFYFFLSPLQANATLGQLKAAGNLESVELKVSAFSLGKIWFSLLKNSTATNSELMGAVGDAAVAAGPVEYRLVPDVRDLLGARMLLTMKPEDGEKLKEAGGMTPEMAAAAIERAMKEAPKFTKSHNEIPVFAISQMRMQRTPAGTNGEESSEEPVTILPMYLSLQNLVNTWQHFISQQDDPALKGMEPGINLMSLDDMVDMMQKESEIDWRNVALIPPAPPMNDAESSPTAAAAHAMGQAGSVSATNPMAGATLGDD